MFFETYPKKIWGLNTKEITHEWAPKRIEFRNKVTPFYHNQWNAVGKYGTGCIYERIREKIETMNIHPWEKSYLISCLIFALDKLDNTVGLQQAYLKGWKSDPGLL